MEHKVSEVDLLSMVNKEVKNDKNMRKWDL